MDQFPINPIDAIVLATLLLSALIAFARGFVLEVLSIGSWIGAAFAAMYGFGPLRPYVSEFLGPGLVADAVTVLALFLGVLVLLSVFSHQISRGLRGGPLGALDRSLGFLFGLARGALFVCLAYLVGSWVVPTGEQPRWVRDARTLPAIEAGATWLVGLAPQDPRQRAELERQREAEQRRFLQQLTVPQPAAPRPAAATAPAAPVPAAPSPAAPAPAVAPSVSPIPARPPAAAQGEIGYGQQDRGRLDQLLNQSSR
jgi:membrane protein required for colicin V production